MGEAEPRNSCAVKLDMYAVAGEDNRALKRPTH